MTMCSSFSHRFSGSHPRWKYLWLFSYVFSGGLLVFLRVDLCALLVHYITCPVALPILTIDWTGLRQRYVYMILLIILSPTPHALLLSVHLSHQKLEMELFYFSKICTIIQIIGITFSAFSFPGFMSIIWLSSSRHPECSGSLCHSYFD